MSGKFINNVSLFEQVTPSANVWSLGVLMWEIMQFGQLPYAELSDDEVLVQVLGTGKRLPHPPSLNLPLSHYL
jgi:serine/threonine protein kinase